MKKLGKKTKVRSETVEAFANCFCIACQCSTCGSCGIYSSATMSRYNGKASVNSSVTAKGKK